MNDTVYHAFVSYSHRADARLAPVLQRALERLGTPWWRLSSVRVFRDDSSLPASAALWPGIEAGLQNSQHFVLLASPAAASSPWVDLEARWWLANRMRERFMIVVTGGEIAYDAAAHDFDWQRTNCLPPALRGVFSTEPYWIDLRFATGPEHLTLRHSRFRGAAVAVGAAIRGVPKDELESADILQHRRFITVAVGSACVAVVLVLATLVASWVAHSESASARSNRLQAESRRLAAEAVAELDGRDRVEAATLKAAIAWRLSPTDEVRRALSRIDKTTPDIARVLAQHTAGPSNITFSRDGKRLVTAGDEGVVLQWSLADGQLVGAPLISERQQVGHLRFSRDGSHLLLHGNRNGSSLLTVFRIADGVRLPIGHAWLEPLRRKWRRDICMVAISPAGKRLVAGDVNMLVTLDIDSNATTQHKLPSNLRLTAISFTDEARLVFLADHDYPTYGSPTSFTRAGELDLKNGRITLGPMASYQDNNCRVTSFADDGSHVASYGSRGLRSGLGLWKVDERLTIRPLPLPPSLPNGGGLTSHYAPQWDASGHRVAYSNGGTIYVWDIALQQMVKTTQKSRQDPPVALSPDGQIGAGLYDPTPVIWQLDASAAESKIGGSRCWLNGLEDSCIQRLCERLTVQTDKKKWRELLGDNYQELTTALEGTACASRGIIPTHLPE